jgi:hypothetical protein
MRSPFDGALSQSGALTRPLAAPWFLALRIQPLPGKKEVAAILPKRNSLQQGIPLEASGFMPFLLCISYTAVHKLEFAKSEALVNALQGLMAES